MLPKPETCRGCPMFQDGRGFVPDQIIPGSKVLVVGQNPGATEEAKGEPFVGETGQKMDSLAFPKAGLTRGEDVSIANTLRCRLIKDGKRTNDMPTGKALDAAIAHCRQYDAVPESTRLIVTQGAHAWRKYGGPGKISEWRGFLAPSAISTQSVHGVRVLGTLHLADLVHAPRMLIPMKLDWLKVRWFLEGSWPEPMPEIWDDTVSWFGKALRAPFVVIDTETTYDDNRDLILVGLWAPGCPVAQFWYEREPADSRREFGFSLRHLVKFVPALFQNSFFDIPVIERHFGITYKDYKRVEDTLLEHNVLWSEWQHDLEFLASLYGRHEKMKHLAVDDPSLYNAGDVVDTGNAHLAMQREFDNDPQSRQVYENFSLPLVPVVLETQKRGIRVNQDRVLRAKEVYEAKISGANRIAAAYCGYPINLNSDVQLLAYLNGVEGMKLKNVKKDTVAAARAEFLDFEAEDEVSTSSIHDRIHRGAHPLLEARVLHVGSAKALAAYITPLFGESGQLVERVFPAYKPWAQANARWSITDPPLMQLPRDLEDIYGPDPGWPWFMWDWDGIELRVFANLAHDEVLLEGLDKGYDVHTIHWCQAMEWELPPLLTKKGINESDECADWRKRYGWQYDDVRRTFIKRLIFRLMYGGDPRFAGNIPGAKALGLKGPALAAASARWLNAHPAVGRFWKGLLAASLPIGTVRTLTGRRRKLLSKDAASMKREIFDYPMQGLVSDIANKVIKDVWARFEGDVYYVYGVHDSQKWAVRESRWDAITPAIKEIAQQAWDFHGRPVVFPATFKERWY